MLPPREYSVYVRHNVKCKGLPIQTTYVVERNSNVKRRLDDHKRYSIKSEVPQRQRLQRLLSMTTTTNLHEYCINSPIYCTDDEELNESDAFPQFPVFNRTSEPQSPRLLIRSNTFY